MQFQAHKGVSTEYPENTLPAYEAAIAQGYDIIELDISVTKDQKMVMLHDDTINRVARHKDSRAIEKPVRIRDITYEEALQYDFGVGFAKKHTGTPIALLEDVLEMASNAGIKIKVDNKYQRFTEQQRIQLLDMLRPYTDSVIMTCNTLEAVQEARYRCPNVEISYDGPVQESILQKMEAVVPKEQLTVWLPLQNQHTQWVTVEFANEKTASMVHKYARLGIWILSDYEELKMAEALGADVVETNGQIKPVQNQGIKTDMHTHSEWSHDSRCPVTEMCEAELAQGVQVLAITDHCDVCLLEEYEIYEMTRKSVEAATAANERFYPQLCVLKGMEICESFWHPEEAEQLTQMCEYDVIIGSIHSVLYGDITEPYSSIDFSGWTQEEIHKYLQSYFKDVIRLVDTQNMDILAHLTCPMRYIAGKYEKTIDIMEHQEAIKEILQKIIAMGIALEVNSSSLEMLGDTMPGCEILQMYKELGGYLLTVGSDAHIAKNAASGIDTTITQLKKLGFHMIFYYKDRKSIPCSIE